MWVVRWSWGRRQLGDGVSVEHQDGALPCRQDITGTTGWGQDEHREAVPAIRVSGREAERV